MRPGARTVPGRMFRCKKTKKPQYFLDKRVYLYETN